MSVDLCDLILKELHRHRIRFFPGGWSCRCGEERTSRVRALSAEAHQAGAIAAAILASQPHHLIEVRPDGWTIQHSMECRIAGQLFDCPFNRAALRLDGPPAAPGRYVVRLDEPTGDLFIAEEVSVP